jgi:hypothetical protein
LFQFLFFYPPRKRRATCEVRASKSPEDIEKKVADEDSHETAQDGGKI